MMRCDTVQRRHALALAATFALFTSAFALSAPAYAGDDNSSGNPFSSVLGFVGLQPDKDKDNIDYRARPPLVVPPTDSLPRPVSASAGRPASWPIDPDESARRRAAADSRRPAPQMNQASGIGANGMRLSKDELLAGRAGTPDPDTRTPTSECQVGSGNAACTGNTVWDRLKEKVGLAKSHDDIVAVGVEPTRKYLTEPPVGYRKPTETTTARNVKYRVAPNAADPYGYIREQSKRKDAGDDN